MKIKDKDKKTIYYTDELNDEFSKVQMKPRVIDEKYNYNKNPIWDFCSVIIQNILSMPIKIIDAKLKFRHKFVGKEKLKKHKKDGYFIYVNHTQAFEDTFIPSLADFPKRNFLIVNPANISLKGTGWIVEMLGAIPIPDTIESTKKFLKQIEKRINQKNSITIYPEAHIWPFYTGIRNFKSVSFKYPVKWNKPAFCMTNTYQSYGKNNDKIILSGTCDINIWYSYENDTKTLVSKQTINYNEEVMVSRKKESNISSNEEIIVRSLRQPSCTKVNIVDGKIEYDIEKELGVEIVGDTKVKIAIEEDEEPWDIIDDSTYDDNISKDIDKEMFSDPRILGVLSGLLMILGLVPGMPTLPFMLIGLTAGGGAFFKSKEKKEEVKKENK